MILGGSTQRGLQRHLVQLTHFKNVKIETQNEPRDKSSNLRLSTLSPELFFSAKNVSVEFLILTSIYLLLMLSIHDIYNVQFNGNASVLFL